ncbi:hypothetical protein CRENBAI_013096 [Crenichthys baileyi]|uniref:Uncharacterized protein n=1 Tax=Crenichthys baileyi TaxID=28760 RepID=A0AAV9SBT7_9TELE
MHHPAHHRGQAKDASPAIRRVRSPLQTEKPQRVPPPAPTPEAQAACTDHAPTPRGVTGEAQNASKDPQKQKPCTKPTMYKCAPTVPRRPTDPPPRQQNALLEGESSCNEMVPICQFRMPLSPPMHRRPPGRCRVPKHAPAQNPGDIPARTQAPLAQPGPQPGGNMPQEPRAPKPTPDPPRNSTGTSPVTYVHRQRAPQKHRMQPPDADPERH